MRFFKKLDRLKICISEISEKKKPHLQKFYAYFKNLIESIILRTTNFF